MNTDRTLRAVVLVGLLAVSVSASDGEPQGKQIVVKGCVEAGVEAGCKMLVSDGGERYNILGDKLPEVGSYVQVRGEPAEVATICMQGKPLLVKKVKVLRKTCR